MNKKFKKIIKIIVQFLGIFVIIFFILYFISNYQSLSTRIQYKFSKNDLDIKSIEKYIIKEGDSEEIIYNNIIIIPKINVRAPIIFSEKEENIENDLILGVSYHPNTSKPGEVGNILISGHSSNYFWKKSDYNSVFVNLSKLENNDEIFVYFKNKRYDYAMFKSEVLGLKEANEEIFKEEDKSILNLVTCWPIGTSWKRLIIKADLK